MVDRPVQDSQFAMVMNVGRTGSTLLDGVFSHHPEILACCETNFFASTEAEAVGPGRYSLYHLSQAWMNRGSGIVARPIALLSEDDIVQVMHDHIMDICSRALVRSGRRVMVGKSPSHMLSVSSQRLSHIVVPGATRIHLVRDFRSVWLSYKGTFPEYWLTQLGVEGFCDTMSTVYESFDELCGIGPIPTFRYEDLKADPVGTLDGMLSAIGVDHSDEVVGKLAGVVGNRIGRFDRWSEAGDLDVDIVSERLGPLLVRYGYET